MKMFIGALLIVGLTAFGGYFIVYSAQNPTPCNMWQRC